MLPKILRRQLFVYYAFQFAPSLDHNNDFGIALIRKQRLANHESVDDGVSKSDNPYKKVGEGSVRNPNSTETVLDDENV